MRKRALITGVAGMVGSHMADFLLATTGWELHGIVRSFRSDHEFIPNDIRLNLHYCDLTDPYAVSALADEIKPDCIFHFAAMSFVPESFTAPLSIIHNNTSMTYNLLTAATTYESTIVLASSAEVYGKTTKTNLVESDPFHMANPYGLSKINTDYLGHFFHEAYGTKTLIARMFTHTGPRRAKVFAESNFARQVALIGAGKQEPVILAKNPNAVRTYMDVRDAVRAYYMLATVRPQYGEAYNIGGSAIKTNHDVIRELLTLSGVEASTSLDPCGEDRPIDADYQVPDSSKFQRHTEWEPEIPFSKTMQDLLDFWRERI